VPTRGPLVDRTPPPHVWTLGTVALFRPRKGLEVLLDSLALLRSQGVNVRLRATGEFATSDYEQRIRKQVQQLGIGDLVRWIGFTQDVPAELAQMDLFVLPSLFGEGLPMVILEAMAAGVPIVATRIAGVPEAIRDGIEGLIANPNDPADLARAIARYVRGQADWSRLRTAAHQRQAERFSDRSMAEGVAEVYQRVLG
jgi:glycosyltransferase involved in cell wall biosynthesis